MRCFWAFFDENKNRICSKLTLRALNIPGKHLDVAQRYQSPPNYSSHKYSDGSNENKWENSKQVLENTTNYFNFRQKSKKSFGVQECHFSLLRLANFDHTQVTRVSKSIYFFWWRQWTSCIMSYIAFFSTWSVTKCECW